MISTVNWTFVSAKGGFAVMDRETHLANITTDGKSWRVCWREPEWALDFEWGNSTGDDALNVCVGYVRGVERCVTRQAHGHRGRIMR